MPVKEKERNTIMKKRTGTILTIILTAALALTALALSACGDNPPPQTYTLTYTAESGGSIQGDTCQTVESGADASTVTAVPNDGFEFAGWSDGVETPKRTDKNVTADITVKAAFRKKAETFTFTYAAGEHGKIEGPLTQTVESGKAVEGVTAVADEYYEFVGWSDGYPTAERWDGFAKENVSATAAFKRKETTLKLNYQAGTAANMTTEVTFNIDNYADAVFPVPTKERFAFQGWFLRYKPINNEYFPNWFAGEEERITDEHGILLPNKEFINADSEVQEIYAKWQATETQTFKVLLVYVTRIEARLPEINEKYYVDVNYTMSADERRYCEAMTKQMKRALDVMMDGLVDFQIDEYYTTQTVVTENFFHGSQGTGHASNALSPDRIPEIRDMLDGYGSALTMLNLDFHDDLYDFSGAASQRYGYVYLDSFLSGLYLDNMSIEDMLSDLNQRNWNRALKTPIHELAHTIETRINAYEFHDCFSYMKIDGKEMNVIYGYKQYYLHDLDIEGEKVGIPYEFWQDKISIVRYKLNSKNGYLNVGKKHYEEPSGDIYFEVLHGFDVPAVTAKPHVGYRFVRWSDGVTTPTRTDTNVTEGFTVTAYFEPASYTVNFTAQEGGKVEGDTYAILQYDNGYASVNAVADGGYEFIGWSDGNTNAGRVFRVNSITESLFDENFNLTLTALFRKIE